MLNILEVIANVDSERFFLLNLIRCYPVNQVMCSMQHGPQKILLDRGHELLQWDLYQFTLHPVLDHMILTRRKMQMFQVLKPLSDSSNMLMQHFLGIP